MNNDYYKVMYRYFENISRAVPPAGAKSVTLESALLVARRIRMYVHAYISSYRLTTRFRKVAINNNNINSNNDVGRVLSFLIVAAITAS